MNDSARMSEVADPDAARYERLERLHLGTRTSGPGFMCNGSRRGPWPSSRRPMDGATNGARAMARSWRNEGLPPVPERVQRQRILTVLAERWNTGYFDGVGMSSLGERAFAGRRFSRAQGAALAVSRTVRRMYDEGLLSPAGFGQHGYRITSKGLAAAKAGGGEG
jgi:hypothetical protein